MTAMRQNKNLPDGTRDILYDEARLYSEITETLTGEFRGRGFRQVMTPAIEYYDVFADSGRFLEPEHMYKLTDNNGRLLVLRADNTMPIARVAATKLKNEPLPQKLYYHQSVYLMNRDYSGKRSEILQSGVEMIGDSGIKSDVICLTTAIHALLALKLPFQIEIGHVGYYNALIAAMGLPEETAVQVRQFVDSKNTVSLNFLSQRSDRLAAAYETIQKIPLLYGGYSDREQRERAMASLKRVGLDKKAQKLKGIVSDVFSIAKATSGVDVNLTKLDFVMLLNQCIADAEDKIADSGKIVKININADSAMVMGDGDKLYRVFQNIVDNALNYSMDGTRIFLDVYKKADRIVFAEKNISATPINFTEEEILERFVRGDKSRTDGGSGLGLSISKSFTEACGGIFNIEIDGDMFKAIVEMPIIQEDTAEKTDDKTE